jgi:hypothetical protein
MSGWHDSVGDDISIVGCGHVAITVLELTSATSRPIHKYLYILGIAGFNTGRPLIAPYAAIEHRKGNSETLY